LVIRLTKSKRSLKRVLSKHRLIPKFELVKSKDLEELKKKYDLTKLPKIYFDDPVSQALKAKPGDVIKFYRKSYVDGNEVIYYRYVIKR